MKHSTRETRYGRLIRTRCADNSLNQYNFTNPADTPYNPKHLGSYARWACDLYADIVVIMADRRCLDQYLDLRGQPACCRELPDGSQKWVRPANGYLLQLLQSIGRDIGTPDNPKPAGVFLADAVPFLGISKAVMYRRKCVYRYCAERYILPLLDIINPKTVVSVGAGRQCTLPSPQPFSAVRHARHRYERPHGAFVLLPIFDPLGAILPISGLSSFLFRPAQTRQWKCCRGV